MQEIIPGTTDAAQEKHVPVCKIEGNKVTVTVGAVEHPMLPEHYIEWISLQTKEGNQRKCLKPGDKPEAVFMIADGDEVETAYAYCNLHSLWKAWGKTLAHRSPGRPGLFHAVLPWTAWQSTPDIFIKIQMTKHQTEEETAEYSNSKHILFALRSALYYHQIY